MCTFSLVTLFMMIYLTFASYVIWLGRMNFERTAKRTTSISSRERKNPTRILNFLLLVVVLLFASFVFFCFFRLPGSILSNFRVYLSLADVSLTSAHAIRQNRKKRSEREEESRNEYVTDQPMARIAFSQCCDRKCKHMLGFTYYYLLLSWLE